MENENLFIKDWENISVGRPQVYTIFTHPKTDLHIKLPLAFDQKILAVTAFFEMLSKESGEIKVNHTL